MSTAGWQQSPPVSGLGVVADTKQKLTELKDGFFRSLYLDKVIKPKTENKEEQKNETVGDVQYFVYPPKEEMDGIDSTMAEIENQMVQEGLKYENLMKEKEKVPAPKVTQDVSGTIGDLTMEMPSSY
jgi:hypothetical protein